MSGFIGTLFARRARCHHTNIRCCHPSFCPAAHVRLHRHFVCTPCVLPSHEHPLLFIQLPSRCPCQASSALCLRAVRADITRRSDAIIPRFRQCVVRCDGQTCKEVSTLDRRSPSNAPKPRQASPGFGSAVMMKDHSAAATSCARAARSSGSVMFSAAIAAEFTYRLASSMISYGISLAFASPLRIFAAIAPV